MNGFKKGDRVEFTCTDHELVARGDKGTYKGDVGAESADVDWDDAGEVITVRRACLRKL